MWSEESDGEEITFAKLEVLLGDNKGEPAGCGQVRDLRWSGKEFVYYLRDMKLWKKRYEGLIIEPYFPKLYAVAGRTHVDGRGSRGVYES